jgi:hypothetical protein
MRAKPIEPGCLALILPGQDLHGWNGLTVTVVRRVSAQDLYDHGFRACNKSWKINIEGDEHYCIAPESRLMRIDDPGLALEIFEETLEKTDGQ